MCMVKDREYLEQFEKTMQESEPVDFKKNFQIQQWLYEEARSLGAFPPADPLDGIESDIRIARILNGVRETS